MPDSGGRTISGAGYDVTPLPRKVSAALATHLDSEVRAVATEAGTECAFTGAFWDKKENGTYVCVVCGLPLFSSNTKFDSGSGWPSYFEPVDPAHIEEKSDDSHGMIRTEVLCARSGTHLGHVFDDGPPPTGRRYCINSASLEFVPEGSPISSLKNPHTLEEASKIGIATFAAGCFWGVEAAFRQVSGLVDARVGYTGGHLDNPTYEMICAGGTGHAEAIEVKFDPDQVSYADLVEVFLSSHDPTQLNRQGPDIGDQYRSAIFFHNEAQHTAALSILDYAHLSGRFPRPIATEVTAAGRFYRAEEYHQRYFERHGGGGCGLRGGL